MKSVIFTLGFLMTTQAMAAISMDCKAPNGELLLEYSAKKVQTIVVNASGVEDAQGTLACEGPQQSAFLCRGSLKLLDSTDLVQVSLVIQEQTLQMGGRGPVVLNNETYQCSPRTK
jgi:hypothetical protein